MKEILAGTYWLVATKNGWTKNVYGLAHKL